MKKTPEEIAKEIEVVIRGEFIHATFQGGNFDEEPYGSGCLAHKEKHIKRIVAGVMTILGYKLNIEVLGHGKTEDGYDCLIVKI